jgi:hypothetical protein
LRIIGEFEMNMIKTLNAASIGPGRQQGVTTLMTGMLVLLLMTIMTFFAVNVGLFEQRTSSNEYRAKQAFKSSEAGLNTLIEYAKANQSAMVLETGTGWFAAGATRWVGCGASTAPPCSLMAPAMAGFGGPVYKYEFGGSNFLPAVMNLQQGGDFDVMALLCILDEDAETCVPRTGNSTKKLALQLIATGQSDDGLGDATTSIVVAPIRLINAAVDAPIVVANTFAGSGRFTLVANPNGGGPGVPLSVWSDADVTLSSNSNARSCHFEQYYQGGTPTEVALTDGGTTTICLDCECPTNEDLLLTGNVADGFDILDNDNDQGPVPDTTNFPDDVFEYVFGVPSSKWKKVRNKFPEKLADCSTIDTTSAGKYWIDGNCNVGDAGSAANPVLLVVAGQEGVADSAQLRINANSVIYGLVVVTNASSGGDPSVALNGSAKVFGAIVSDTDLDLGNGTIHIVYNKEVLSNLDNDDNNAWGAFPGTWLDFVAN